MSQPIAYVEFADGEMRRVFEDARWQYVIADDREPDYRVWFVPREESGVPVIMSVAAE